jgi:hypothetical protein
MEALRTIREHSGTQASSAIAVYMALCVIASIRRKQTFQCEIKQIAGHAGLRYRSCFDYLGGLEAAKVISIQRNSGPKSKTAGAASTYTLLSLRTYARNAYPPMQGLPTGVCTGSASRNADSIEEILNNKGVAVSHTPVEELVVEIQGKEGTPEGAGFALGAQPAGSVPPSKNQKRKEPESNQW